MYHSYCHYLSSNFTFGTMAEETKVNSERMEAIPDVNMDTGRTGRGDNINRNQQFRKTTKKFVGKTMEKFI